MAFSIWFLYSIFAKVSILIQVLSWVERKVERKVERSLWKENLIILSLVILFIFLFYYIQIHNINDLYVKGTSWLYNRIIFINDKYIITDTEVLRNNADALIKIVKNQEDYNKLQELFNQAN